MAHFQDRAILVLKEAVFHEKRHELQQAITCYMEGSELMKQYRNSASCPSSKKAYLYEKTQTYLRQAELLRQRLREQNAVQQQASLPAVTASAAPATAASASQARTVKTIQINDGQTGYDYQTIFQGCIETATEVHVKDPFIAAPHQLHNYLRLCELLVRSATNLQTIRLDTKMAPANRRGQQERRLKEELKASLQARGVAHHVRYDDSLHDRQVSCNNGYVIRMSRGLDMFQAPAQDGRFFLGLHDYGLRACKSCTIEIIQDPAMKTLKR